MIIRKATINDSKFIAPYLLLAMEEIIYEFICVKNYDLAIEFLCYFIEKENNQYSYQNCYVAVEENKIIAAINLFDGGKLSILRAPVAQYIKSNFNKDFNPEDETQLGEYYIDSFGVDPIHQRKGIGSKILQFLIDKYVYQNQLTIGLLVEVDNPSARKLYVKVGFKTVGKKFLVGKSMEHLQIKS